MPKASFVEQLRVGFFTEVYRPVVNGVVASVDGLAAGLRGCGHEVYCFAPRMPGAERSDGAVFRMPSLPIPSRSPYRLTLPLVSRRNVNTVIKRLSLIHVHSPFITGWMGLRYARRYSMPVVYTYHTQLEAYAHYVPFDANATRFAASQLTRTFGNMVDAVIVPTAAMVDHLRDLGVTSRIEVVASGIDIGLFGGGIRSDALRAQLRVGARDRLVLFVSRLAIEKNLDIVLRALARAKDASLKLVIAGDGPARADLERLARSLGLAEQIAFLGEVERAALPDLYASADAFVFPSTTETQGLVQAEALAAGSLVIAADTPQNRDVLGGVGLLCSPDERAFAAALRAIPVLPDAVAAARARVAAQRFAIGDQIDRTLMLYRSLVEGGRISDSA